MRIGSSLFGVDLMAQHSLSRAFGRLNDSSTRLSTMLRINRGSDDPAGLIAVETLRAELAAINAATDNAARAGAMIQVADSGMSQVTGLLNDIRANVVSAAGGGLSDAEIAAKQIEIDAALEAINRIGNTTSFGSRKLLDGTAGFEVPGTNASQVTNVEVISNAGGAAQTPEIEVTQAAQAAEMTFSDADGTLDEDISFVLTGDEGTAVFEFSAGATLDQIALAIATSSQSTGLTATVDGTDLTISSTAVGSDASVSVEVLEGAFDTGATTVDGTDIVVNVDGIEFTGDANAVEVNTATFHAKMEFAEGFTGEVDPITISGDALTFSFSPDLNDKATLGMPTITSAALGGAAGRLSQLASGGSASLKSGNAGKAMDILDASRDEVLRARARAGAFQKYTVESSQSLLGSMEVNISAAASAIGDTDVAAETSRLIQSQILVNAAISSVLISGQNRGLIGSLFNFM